MNACHFESKLRCADFKLWSQLLAYDIYANVAFMRSNSFPNINMHRFDKANRLQTHLSLRPVHLTLNNFVPALSNFSCGEVETMRKRGKDKRKRHSNETFNKNAMSPQPQEDVPRDKVADSHDSDVVAYASDGSDIPAIAYSDGESCSDVSGDDLPLVAVPTEENGNSSDIDVTFEFFDPVSFDAKSLCILLSTYCCENHVNANNLADAIIKQPRVGTCVKIVDEPAAVAFITCLNVARHATLLKGLLSKILEAGEGDANTFVTDVVRRGFENGDEEQCRMGLIATERVLNLPPVLVAKMQEAIFCEIEWATEDESEEEDRKSFKFRWYLYVTEAYCKPTASNSSSRAKRQRKASRKFDEIAFSRPEDEAWMQAAEESVAWKIDGEQTGAQGLTRMRMAMVVPAKNIPGLRSRTCEIVGFKVDKEQVDSEDAEKQK